MASGSDDALPKIPELEGDFDLVRELGRGATAIVYLARDRTLGRDVAIKLIRPSYLQDEEAVARLEREARTVGKLQHPNIVLLLGTRRLGSQGLALILQYVPGETLKELVQREGSLPFHRVESILSDVAQALAYAHRRRIVHRDIKPENVYLDEDAGVARLADFGIARAWDSDSGLTMPGTALGTPAYMSPEQVDGKDLDGRSDIYSLGALGWELLTGRQPWAGESLYNVIYKQKKEELPPVTAVRPDIPGYLRLAVEKALRKDPEDRWASAEEFLETLASGPVIGEEDVATSGGAGTTALGPGDRRRSPSTVSEAGPGEAWAIPPLSQSGPDADPRHAMGGYHGPHPSGGDPAAQGPPGSQESTRRRWWLGASAAAVLLAVVLGASLIGPDSQIRSLFSELVASGEPGPDPGQWEREGTSDGWAVDAETAADDFLRDPASPGESELAPFGDEFEAGDPDFGFRPQAEAPPSGPLPEGTRLSLIQGGGQTAEPDQLLSQAVVLRVLGPEGDPLPRVEVEFEVLEGGGTLTPSRPISDSDGWVVTRWRMGETPGPQRAQALLPEGEIEPVELTATADVRSIARIEVVSGDSQSGEAGQALSDPIAIRVLDSGGEGVPGRTVRFQVSEGNGEVSPSSAVTDASGTARTTWTLGSASGSHTLVGQVSRGPGEEGDQVVEVTVQASLEGPSLSPRPIVAGGGSHTCALSGGGALSCWGAGSGGQLGDGTRSLQPTPVSVPGQFSRVAVGLNHTCALDTAGTVYCWGANAQGQLGTGSTTSLAEPGPGVEGVAMTDLAAGASHTCGLSSTGEIHCWGDNRTGQLGDGSTTSRSEPVRVGSGGGFRQVVAGWQHTCALSASGGAVCWGSNAEGQLGRSSGPVASTPGSVSGNHTFSALSAGSAHTCGLRSDGQILCWGANDHGQLGDGSREPRPRATPVEAERAFRSVTAGAQHTCGIDEDGGALCWGRNVYGQVGDGSGEDRTVPTPVEGNLRFQTLMGLGSHTCGLTQAGERFCWGYNADGQVGDGSRANRSTPTPVGSP